MIQLHGNGVCASTIAWLLNRHLSTVRRCIARARSTADLQDRPRSGRPAVYSEAVRFKTIAFYCQTSPLPGCSSWSLRWAQDYLTEHPEITGYPLSHSTIHRILHSHSLRPHMHRYFLSITDPDFFPKMDHIIDLYLHPPEYLFCFDECTGLQATNRIAPQLSSKTNTPVYDDFHYRRNGTTDLLAFLRVKTGKVHGRCAPRHDTATLVEVFREHVSLFPSDAQLHYIMDNLSTHFHEDFCATVADLSGISYEPLKTGEQRRGWLQAQDKRIVVHFIPFHGSWLNMIEIWFGILSKKCLKHQSFTSVSVLTEAIVEFIDTWNLLFAHPFRWKYTGEGLHEKAISRFNTCLITAHKQMDATFLSKQLKLMCNIARGYRRVTESKEWQQLCELIGLKAGYIDAVANAGGTEKKTSNAREALEELRELIAGHVPAVA